MNFFKSVEQLPPDPIFGLNTAFAADNRKNKVNLGAGVYKTAELKPFILNTVKNAEKLLIQLETSKDYLSIDGEKQYLEKTRLLVFGETSSPERIYGAQSVGATSALLVGASFLKELKYEKIYIPDPSWENHRRVFLAAGLEVDTYPYYKPNGIDFENLCHFLKNEIPNKSSLILHASCHNPTGFDPKFEEWKEIQDILAKRDIFPFFDFSYQGLGTNLDEDAKAIRYFAEKGMQFAVAISHAKNFGLYAERPGALYFVCSDQDEARKVGSHVKTIIRGLYSNPPCHGARIVAIILEDENLKKHWISELTAMRERIGEMRRALTAKLHIKLPKDNFDFVLSQKGMFSFVGLEEKKVDHLTKEFGIYLPKNGRINIAGLNTENME